MRRLLPVLFLLVLPTASLALPPTATTTEVARGFLHRLYDQQDVESAYREFADPELIEHNPEIPNGVTAKIEFFRHRQAEHPDTPPPSTWANVVDHLIIDGDMFAVHHHVFGQTSDPGRVFVDIWRVDKGRIVEHWDVIQTVPPPRNPGQPTMWCGKGSNFEEARRLHDTARHPSCGPAGPAAHTQASRRLLEDYASALSGPGAAAAVTRFNAPALVQHSPHIDQGIAALTAHMNRDPALTTTQSSPVTVARILAQGDLVLVHRHRRATESSPEYVAGDLFRVSGGRIVEHWDVQQRVPATSANGHTMW